MLKKIFTNAFVVSILVILLVTGVVYGLTSYFLYGQVVIVEGTGVQVYSDWTNKILATEVYDCGITPIGESKWFYFYLHNPTSEDILVEAEQTQSDKIDIRLWLVLEDGQRYLQTQPLLLGADATAPIAMQVFALPLATPGSWGWQLEFKEVIDE